MGYIPIVLFMLFILVVGILFYLVEHRGELDIYCVCEYPIVIHCRACYETDGKNCGRCEGYKILCRECTGIIIT
jgi:hypothetical protein